MLTDSKIRPGAAGSNSFEIGQYITLHGYFHVFLLTNLLTHAESRVSDQTQEEAIKWTVLQTTLFGLESDCGTV